MKTTTTLIFLIISFAGLAQVAPYVGAGVGIAKAKIQCPNGNCDQTSVGYKFFGGINFNKTFSIELSYLDFGSSHGNGALANGSTFDASVHTRALGATIGRQFGVLPRVSIRPAIGISTNFASLNYPSFTSENLSKTNFTYLAAVSIDYRLTPYWQLRLQGDVTQTKPYAKPGTATLISIGGSYIF